MTQWTGGYVADINYTHGYYHELNPLRAAMALAHAGIAMPAAAAACELGFGQGLSTNLHAAASATAWHGTDFIPAQAAFARELAQTAGSGAQLAGQSFAEYCQRDDLPDFDYIGLHGVWSWVPEQNRALLLDFVQRKLKPGGVLYISYNCQPGWAPMVPLRDLLTEVADATTAADAGTAHRIDAALDFARELVDTQPAYFEAFPVLAERLATLQGQDRRYLAHEYFNQDWEPTRFARMAARLDGAGLRYGCSALLLDQVALLNLSAAQRALLDRLPDPTLVQSVRDVMVNQNFRRDYWVKDGGTRSSQLAPAEHDEAMRRQRVVLVMPRQDVTLTVKTSMLEVELNAAAYAPLLDLLADHQPRTVAELEAALPMRGGLKQLFEAVFILCGTGTLAPAQAPAMIADVREQTRRLNRGLYARARDSEEISYLACPVTGGGLPMPRIPQLFLLAQAEGRHGASAWADFVWDILAGRGETLQRDGQRLTTPEANLAELRRKADIFERDYLPMYRALGIAE